MIKLTGWLVAISMALTINSGCKKRKSKNPGDDATVAVAPEADPTPLTVNEYKIARSNEWLEILANAALLPNIIDEDPQVSSLFQESEITNLLNSQMKDLLHKYDANGDSFFNERELDPLLDEITALYKDKMQKYREIAQFLVNASKSSFSSDGFTVSPAADVIAKNDEIKAFILAAIQEARIVVEATGVAPGGSDVPAVPPQTGSPTSGSRMFPWLGGGGGYYPAGPGTVGIPSSCNGVGVVRMTCYRAMLNARIAGSYAARKGIMDNHIQRAHWWGNLLATKHHFYCNMLREKNDFLDFNFPQSGHAMLLKVLIVKCDAKGY